MSFQNLKIFPRLFSFTIILRYSYYSRGAKAVKCHGRSQSLIYSFWLFYLIDIMILHRKWLPQMFDFPANSRYGLESKIFTPTFLSLNLGVGERKMNFETLYNHSNYKYDISLERSWIKLSIDSWLIVMTSLMTSLEVKRSTFLWPS